jgi:Ca2+-binding EF-hand superfamily protein
VSSFSLPGPLYLLSKDGTQLSEEAEPCFKEVFDRMNMDMDGHMNKKEVKKFLKVIQPGFEPNYVRNYTPL